MTIEMIEGVRTLNVDMIGTTAIALLSLMLGYFLRKRFPVFERICLPASVIGGFIWLLFVLLLRATGVVTIEMDTTLQLPFMLAFFTCVGFSGSFKLLKAGGKALLAVLIVCWGLAIIQGFVGVGMAKVLQIDPVLGIMAGPVSLVGGHGNAAAFGPVAENLGTAGAETVAVASATFGLVVGSLIGGPMGDFIIKRKHVKVESASLSAEQKALSEQKAADKMFSMHSFLSIFTLVFVFMFGGVLLSLLVERLNISNFAIPNYVGGMFLAIVFRNINDRYQLITLEENIIELIKGVGLDVFLTMSIMTLKVWELADLAGPILIILAVQLIVLLVLAYFAFYPILGKNYDGAVMTGGLTGWGMGISATSVVSMSAITEKYGLDSPVAFLVVPLSGAVFVDFVAIPLIIFLISQFA